MDDVLLAQIIIERRLGDEGGPYVVIRVLDGDGDPGLASFEILGMLEMAKVIAASQIGVEDA